MAAQLCDVNVWLALALSGHAQHFVARQWFDSVEGRGEVLFCRSTQQSFLRLLTNTAVLAPYGNKPLTNAAAWSAYESFLADERIAGQHPGLEQQPDYWWSSTYVDLDYRDQPGNVRSGGHFRVSYDAWRDQQDYGFSFRDLRVEGLHAFPIFDKKRVFIARVMAQSLDSPAGNTVPFYAMPTLGGSTTLRGFRFEGRDPCASRCQLSFQVPPGSKRAHRSGYRSW